MYRFKIFSVAIISLFFLLCFPYKVFAEDPNQFITVVNPVRISAYGGKPAEGMKSEYQIIRKNKISATWLMTYDAMQNPEVMSVARGMDKSQEFGIFVEVTPTFSEDSKITYHNTGSWHHAASVFLSGYAQEDRRVLIDKVFQTFKGKFGYYPKSVGSWWTDAYSLSYMKEKYGIIANLVCSDQYSTDGYQIWGQPWGLPYYPSKLYSAVPPSTIADKIDVVNLQWAPRDPLNGYTSSLYSTQDYLGAPIRQDVGYFQKLINIYMSMNKINGFAQVTVGLESDLDPDGYKGEFAKQIEYVNSLTTNGIKILTMADFSTWYRQKFTDVSPSYKIESKDLLGKNMQSFWYGSSKYRLFYIKDFDKKEIKILDLRIYNSTLKDPYYDSPNFQFTLSENIPAVIDTVSNTDNIWILQGDFEIITDDDNFTIKGRGIKVPDFVKKSPLIDVIQTGSEVKISTIGELVPAGGIEIKDFSAEAIHFFRQKLAFFYLLTGRGWNYLTKVSYTIPQGEVYALLYLKSQPFGRVLVYDNECLQCSWHTEFKPPEFSNRRGYVGKYSGNPVVYNKSVFAAKTQTEAKKEFDKLHAKYVYLTKFEDYTEKLPFSPGDLNVEKIFSNANAEIWRVK
ncbi:MAG: hypothetical protein HYV90_02830 [Candidatus Woesebacteria bacterium]|nr:MAG: hypothetical protein HYV90_02830 [Candidatus Woesebacteria bacterium]